MTDAECHIMTSTNGSQPHYVSGLEENVASELCAGGNFAFVIGKTTGTEEEESPAKEYEAVESHRSQEVYDDAQEQPEVEDQEQRYYHEDCQAVDDELENLRIQLNESLDANRDLQRENEALKEKVL